MSITRMLHIFVVGFATLLFAASGWAQTDRDTDATSAASPDEAPTIDKSRELPVRRIPNIPSAAEAYYAPDDYHFIAQTQDPAAQQPEGSRVGGALTYIFTDDGKLVRRINDRGQDACSYFFPDQQRIVWTSTRDRMDMTSFNLGPEHYKGIPDTRMPADPMLVTDFTIGR